MERIAEMKSTSNDCTTIAVARRAYVDAERALYEAKEKGFAAYIAATDRKARVAYEKRRERARARLDDASTTLGYWSDAYLEAEADYEAAIEAADAAYPTVADAWYVFYNVKVDLKNALLHAEWALMAAERNAAQ